MIRTEVRKEVEYLKEESTSDCGSNETAAEKRRQEEERGSGKRKSNRMQGKMQECEKKKQLEKAT